MDYEILYKNALERAKKFIEENPLVQNLNTWIKETFPELKEPEDEKVRKALIEMVHDTTGDELWVDYNVHKEEALAWLEKQGEQKPSDKVEPKFKVGDWVIDKQGIVHQIANVIENLTNHTYGYDIVGGGYFNDNTEGVRLWTIKDAKDGDVLACENGWTCIFKCLNDNLFSSHCFMDHEGWFCEDGGQGHTLDNRICGEIYPSTKEQRDLLFQKMHEAGYEWDADKKELKKISQRMISAEAKEAMYAKTAWSEEDERTIKEIDEIIYECPYCESKEEISNWLKSLKQRIGG